MTFGLHCAEKVCTQYKLPRDFPAAIAAIIDHEIKAYAENLGMFDPTPPEKAGKNIPPTVGEIRAYITKIGARFDPDAFFDHYEANGWKVGRTKMVNWQAACRTWKQNQMGLPLVRKTEAVKTRSAYDIQTRLEACKKELRNIVNPGGAAWPIKPTGDAAKRADELSASIRRLEIELCQA